MKKLVMKESYEYERLQNAALFELNLLKQEFDLLVENTQKAEEPSKLFEGLNFSFNNNEMTELLEERKDRKYAAFTIELYAIVEQLLKDIYEKIHSKPFVKQQDKNVIYELEKSLVSHLTLTGKGSLKNIAGVRNFIIHDTFSMKKARKDKKITENYKRNTQKNIPDKSKKLYLDLHENVVAYIKGISFNIGE